MPDDGGTTQGYGPVRDVGGSMHQLMADLFPICRSITGDGLRATLEIICRHLPLQITEVPSGTKVFDWVIPEEWNVRSAYIEDENGCRVVDFSENNLHLVGYSTPVDTWISLSELQGHLFSLEQQPDAIPYVTSYYKKTWGFCMAHNARVKLRNRKYHVVIDSHFKKGSLAFGELLIPGATDWEVFLSTYICHPSMANNELSGPVILTFLAKWLLEEPRRFSYRIVFLPETIGSIAYLSRNLGRLKNKVEVGFNLSCLGDDNGYSYVASPYENTLADRIAEHVLVSLGKNHKKYSYLERGSDERQYCSPGVNLPLVTLCRSKFGAYPEYHTSLDNLEFVTANGLAGGYEYVRKCLEVAEMNRTYRAVCCGEPQLGRRNLYPSLSIKGSACTVRTMSNLLTYADGTNDLVSIGRITGSPVWELDALAQRLVREGLLIEVAKGAHTRSSLSHDSCG